MGAVVRLVTYADIGAGDDPLVMSVSLRQDAVLADGRQLVLLDDRGWSSTLCIATNDAASDAGVPDVWSTTSVAELEADARVVVGPDEPYDEHSQSDMEEAHWAFLAAKLHRQGVVVDGPQLRDLPHEVIVSDRLLARIG
jgi:hypothetical protein